MPHKFTFPNIRVRGVTRLEGSVYLNGQQLGGETGGEARPYKVYAALISQIGANAPVAIVLENELLGLPALTRQIEGIYRLILVGAFPEGKVWCSITNGAYASAVIDVKRVSNDVLVIYAQADDVLSNASLEIRVYD